MADTMSCPTLKNTAPTTLTPIMLTPGIFSFFIRNMAIMLSIPPDMLYIKAFIPPPNIDDIITLTTRTKKASPNPVI